MSCFTSSCRTQRLVSWHVFSVIFLLEMLWWILSVIIPWVFKSKTLEITTFSSSCSWWTTMYRITKILVLRPVQMLLLPDKPVQLPHHVCNPSSMNSTTCGLKIFRGKNSCLSLLNTDVFWHWISRECGMATLHPVLAMHQIFWVRDDLGCMGGVGSLWEHTSQSYRNDLTGLKPILHRIWGDDITSFLPSSIYI